ncbi:unnamed protein product [Ambrosiozyma monospora]|uniref:Unnamed protein product n=1 Tax=Ambrosiozyma monospora TaxID=43982 RepID=A0ACB5T289_AMBMO|nr:unnamed protein product [Ambrosiozyma monospora]
MSDEERAGIKSERPERNPMLDDAAEQSDDDELDKLVDSSEEDDDEDEDEEAMREVREGFIVDDEEEESRKRRKKHKRKHRLQEEDEELDEDDLALLRENLGEKSAPATQFKRLKRAAEETDNRQQSKGLDDMFSDEEGQGDDDVEGGAEEEDDDLLEASRKRQHMPSHEFRDEFDDFIDDDEFSDDDEDKEEKLARMRSARAKQIQFAQTSQLDQDKLDELYEIFGDGEEYAWALEAEAADDDEGDQFDEYGQLIPKAKKDPQALTEVFEYEELKEHLLTDKDQEIRITDVPERFQTLREGIKKYDLDDQEFSDKQQWVADTFYNEKLTLFQEKELNKDAFLKAVAQIVHFISRDNLEVPTIWNCRKDYTLHTYRENGQLRVQKLLNENDLWRILQLDIDYHAIYEKKQAIKKMYESLPDETLDLIYEDFIKSAKSISELQDLHDYLSFTYSEELKDTLNTKQKSHSKYSIFEKIKKSEIYNVVKNMGIDAEKFGDNVAANTQIFLTDDYIKSPQELIKETVRPHSYFDTEEKAMHAVKRIFSEQLSVNPKLRAQIRKTFEKYAIIDIEHTEKGKTKITNSSPYADFNRWVTSISRLV